MATKTSFTSVALLLLFLFILSCTPELTIGTEPLQEGENSTTKSFANVDERLWSYFESFENEAAKRNISLDLNQKEITGEITNIPEDGVAGTCRYGLHIHHVTIDLQVWNRSSNTLREMIIYHELGHCVLERDHKETSNNNGQCLSIMNSGTTNCRVAYNAQNKGYYLDELFTAP